MFDFQIGLDDLHYVIDEMKGRVERLAKIDIASGPRFDLS